MSGIPDSENGYEFTENKSVDVGDPTEAEDDYNELAENADHLKEGKVWGWRGECYSDESRRSKKTGAGVAYCTDATAFGTSKALIDPTHLPMLDDNGFMRRPIWISGSLLIVNSGSAGPAHGFLPGGPNDRKLQGTAYEFGPYLRRLRIEELDLYGGEGDGWVPTRYWRKIRWDDVSLMQWYGTDPLMPDNAVEVTFWVDAETGNLMMRLEGYGAWLGNFDQIAYCFKIEYGPQWVTG